MDDLIKRADAIKALDKEYRCTDKSDDWDGLETAIEIIGTLPSAETHEIRTETHGVCLISKDDAIEAVQTYLNILINSRRHGDDFTFINVLTEIRNKISALPSADAVQIHNDGTLEIKVPNAHKVGRVLVMDTDSHIGGGLFYPDDAVQGDWVKDYEKNIYKCSVCGCEEVVPTCMGEPTVWKYCPNCGSAISTRMKGGAE